MDTSAAGKIDFKSHAWAILFCFIAAIGALCYGYDNTYYNGVLAMQEFKNDYGSATSATGAKALDPNFQAVTASAIYIGDLLGALIAAPINDRWGRKAVFWFASACVLIGGIIQVSDRTGTIAVITVGRIVMGFGVGQFTVTSLLYMGEVSPLAIRGPVLMMFQFLQSLSQLVASGITQGSETIPSSLSYKLPMGGLIVLPLFMFAGLPFIPESPVWYVLKGRREEAERALRKINKSSGASYDPAIDLEILDDVKLVADQSAESASWRSLLTDPVERTKVYYSAGAMFSNQVCGILFFYVYGVVFAQEIGISDPFLIQLIQNILQIFAVGASILTSNKVSRRVNLFVTCGIMLVAFLIIGGIGTQKLNTAMQYIIVVFSYLVIIAYNYGLGPLAYTIARETAVGPNQNKIMSTSIVVFYLTTWVISFTAPYMYYNAGMGPMVGFVYAGTTALAMVWVWFCVGETTGRTGLEISLFFANGVPARKWASHTFGGDVGDDPKMFAVMDAKSGVAGAGEHLEKADV